MSAYPYASIHADYIIAVDRCFDRLQAHDGELCVRLIATLGDRQSAIVWLTTYKLAGGPPIVLLSAGRRSEVIDVLIRLKHGVCT
jgi:hypothetical protein